MAKLITNVHVADEIGRGTWYGPDYPQNGDPPEGTVTNPAAFASDADKPEVETSDAQPASEVPPRGGPGSGRDAWAVYAEGLGAQVDPEASRDDIIAALEAAGHPTE